MKLGFFSQLVFFLAGPLFSAEPGLTPTAAVASVSVSVAVQAVATPSFVTALPMAPQGLRAEFVFVTKAAETAKPSMRLFWEASEPGTYMLKGYRVQRRLQSASDFEVRMGADVPVQDTMAEDAVEIGKAYDYRVLAVDVKGNSSEASAAVSMDLSRLDSAMLAPRAPLGLTATSARISTRLKWDAAAPWLDAVSAYRIYRSGTSGFLTSTVLTNFEDLSPASKVDFTYHVTTFDSSGRESAPSLTVSARATGTLAPEAPPGLTATVKSEKASLSWEKSEPGTAPVTAYLLTRVIEPGLGETEEIFKEFKPLEPNRNSYGDSVEGEHFYRYELRAADLEGNRSEASKLRLWVPGKPFNKTAVILMPTAYTNFQDKDTGLNVNVLFDLYIGALYETYTNPKTGVTKTGLFQPLQSGGQLGVVSLDFKGSFLEETWLTPALATGFYGAALVPFGGVSSQQVAVTSSGGGFQTLGNIYGVMSKRFGRRSAIHAGGMFGKLADSVVSVAPSDWEPTLRHLTPGGNYPDLFNRFLDPKLGAEQPTSAPHMLFAAIQFPVTIPFGFARWKTGLKLEVMAPVFPELNSQLSSQDRDKAIRQLPLVWNIHIDNLPLFGFEFSLFQFDGGFEWIAFYHIPDLTWSF